MGQEKVSLLFSNCLILCWNENLYNLEASCFNMILHAPTHTHTHTRIKTHSLQVMEEPRKPCSLLGHCRFHPWMKYVLICGVLEGQSIGNLYEAERGVKEGGVGEGRGGRMEEEGGEGNK